MKFVKVRFFGKEYYKAVGDDYKKDDFIELQPPADNESDTVGRTKEFLGRVSDSVKGFTNKVASSVKELGNKAKAGTLFQKEETTEEKLLSLLPYMDTKSRSEVCERLLEGDEALCKIDLGAFLPFFSKDDCDALFVAAIRSGNIRYKMESVAPYVSKKCYHELVDRYLAGELAWLDIDTLYPYLSDADIKRIFHHIVNKEQKQTAKA